MKRLTTELFIEKAKVIHGNKYDYSLVDYRNTSTNIIIVCPIHGSFHQAPNSHLNGRGCQKCGSAKTLVKLSKNQKDFILEANVIHKGKYDYSLAIYKNTKTKVSIVCPIHGAFLQMPFSHLRGHGCVKCGIDKVAEQISTSQEDFILKSNIIHNNKYDYSLVVYKGNKNKIQIICPIHKIFNQIAADHLNGHGCRKCYDDSKKLTSLEFIDKANKIHNGKYDYSVLNYIDCFTELTIICPFHKEFTQLPTVHLSGCGCPYCSHFVSKPETAWLDGLNVPMNFRNKRIFIDGKRYNVDAYDPNTNTIYEFYGDYWHGNPEVFDQNIQHPFLSDFTYGELYERTINRESILKAAGYKLIVIWENDFVPNRTNRKITIQEIIK